MALIAASFMRDCSLAAGPPHLNSLLALAGLGDVVGGIHFDRERFLPPQLRLAATRLKGGIKMALAVSFEAKTHLADLLDRVSHGEKIMRTKHGIPAALLVLVEESRTRMTHKDIVEGMLKLRKRIKPGKMSIRQMVEEGRHLPVFSKSLLLTRQALNIVRLSAECQFYA